MPKIRMKERVFRTVYLYRGLQEPVRMVHSVIEFSELDDIETMGDGKVEESITAVDGMVKSLRIIKKGCVFGCEGLLAGGEARTTYTVISPQVKIVEIDKDILAEVFRRKPEGWLALLEREMDQKYRLQRLWTME